VLVAAVERFSQGVGGGTTGGCAAEDIFSEFARKIGHAVDQVDRADAVSVEPVADRGEQSDTAERVE